MKTSKCDYRFDLFTSATVPQGSKSQTAGIQIGIAVPCNPSSSPLFRPLLNYTSLVVFFLRRALHFNYAPSKVVNFCRSSAIKISFEIKKK